MAGAAQTIGWILTIDDTDLNNKLGSISANVGAVKDALTSSVADAIQPAVGMLKEIRDIGEEIRSDLESFIDPDNWKDIAKSVKDMKPTVDSVKETVETADKAGILTKGWWASFKEFSKKQIWKDIGNAFVDIFKITGFLLATTRDIALTITSIMLTLKTIAGPVLSLLFAAGKKVITSFLNVGLGLIGTLTKGTLRSGRAVVSALANAFTGLGKFAAKSIGAALGPIYTVMAFLTVGLRKALGPVFSIINEFVSALMFAFEPFFMAFRMLLIPFVFRMLPLIIQGVAIMVVQIAELIETASKWWDKWFAGGWSVFWEDLKYLSAGLWEDLKVAAGQFWGWLKTDGWDNFRGNMTDAWAEMKAAILAFGGWFETTAWPVIVKGLGILYDWLEDVLPRAWNSWQTWVNKTMVPWVMGLRERAIDGLSKALTTAWKFWEGRLNTAWKAVQSAFKGIVNIFMIPINWIRATLGKIVMEIGNLISRAGAKAIGSRIKGVMGMGKGLQSIGRAINEQGGVLSVPVKPLAEGGLVTKPTLALVGERGPEIVIPMSSQEVSLATGADAAVKPIDDPLKWFKDVLGQVLMALEKIEENTTDSNWINDGDYAGHSQRGDWEG